MAKKVDQLAKILPTSWDGGSGVHYSKLTDSVNTLLGYNGPVPFQNSLDLNNNAVQNVADPKAATDAVNLQTADSKYSAKAVGSKLDVGGENAMPGLTALYYQSQKGLSVTITTAKLTTGGTNGSLTFTKGILTSQKQAT